MNTVSGLSCLGAFDGESSTPEKLIDPVYTHPFQDYANFSRTKMPKRVILLADRTPFYDDQHWLKEWKECDIHYYTKEVFEGVL